MTSYRFEVGGKRRSHRLLGRIRRALLEALMEEKKEHGLTQQKIAEKLDVHRSVINRQLTGEANLSLKSLAELTWALDREFVFELRRTDADRSANAGHGSSTSEVTKFVDASRKFATGQAVSISIPTSSSQGAVAKVKLFETAV